jgi:cell shape-determining protein MreD
MRPAILFLFVLILFGVMQGLARVVPIGGIVPNLLLLLVLCLALEQGNDFILVALIAGIMSDMGSGAIIGTFTVGYLTIGVIFHYVMNQFFYFQAGWKYLPVALVGGLVFLSVWMWFYSWILLQFHITSQSVFASPIPGSLFAQIVYSLVLLYPVYLVTNKVVGWIKKLEQKQRFG